MVQPASQWTSPDRQFYVRKFALVYCVVTLCFSGYFTPQDFNLKVSVIVNFMLFLIGAPYWFRKTRIPPYALNVISQLGNAGASVWICSFLGPTSHINLVAIPQFILALMMFSGIHPKTTVAAAVLCLFQLSLPLFPFVDTWYAHKRMREPGLVVLREILDITIFGLSTYQFKIISEAWAKLLRESESEKLKAQKQNEWRKKLLHILSHDIKEPVVHSLLAVRNLKRRAVQEDALVVNQIESAQVSIKEMITNVEHSNQDLDEGRVSSAGTNGVEHTVEGVFGRIKSWYDSRLQEKEIQVDLSGADSGHRIQAGADAFIYQIFMNLFSNAIKFTPQGGTIFIRTQQEADGVVWSIQDEGEGIRSDAFSDEPVSRAGTLGETGSGLGIKIARAFAEDHGITLAWSSVHTSDPALRESAPAVGTIVYLKQRQS